MPDIMPPDFMLDAEPALIVLFAVIQGLYAATFMIDIYLFSLPINWVKVGLARGKAPSELPPIILFYPVLRELEETMRTTFLSMTRLEYPADRYRVIAIPNADDASTIVSLRRLQSEFSFLEILEVPSTSHASWQVVWDAWDRNPNAYWWHEGRRRRVRDLPPKKTRQLIYAFYTTLATAGSADFLVNYIDADSCPPPDHFLAGAAGMQTYDVLQSTNVAGNLNVSLAASWHAFDHMAWDGLKYPHLSANGRQPFWMLGKGLFFRASDLFQLGSFHPWLTIEDPEVGMRFWAAGKRLGIIENPLIEEVPRTFGRGITQRKRWVAGFFQSLTDPLVSLGLTPFERFKAWLNFLPCLSLWINAIGFPLGVWGLWTYLTRADILPLWLVWLSVANLLAFAISMTCLYVRTWIRTALVLDKTSERIWYMLRVNPLFVMIWWVVWLIPLAIGLWMYLRDGGLVWQRTEKVNANQALIEARVRDRSDDARPALSGPEGLRPVARLDRP
jgi:glycosyltransferase XagB